MRSDPTRVVKNASWILAGRGVQAVLGLIVTMLSARYLGPGNYGLISYAASVAAFVTPVILLGYNSVLVQELVERPEREGTLLGTAVLLSLGAALLGVLGVAAFAFLMNGREEETVLVCVLYSLLFLGQAAELIRYWFQARYLAKFTSLVSLGAYVLVSAYKIFLLASGKSVLWFAVSQALDYLLIAGALFLLYPRLGGGKLGFSLPEGKRLFRRSRYYIISGLLAVVYAQTDRIMLKNMLDNAVTGEYTAAVTCAGLATVVMTALIDSMRPYILEAREDRGEFERRIARLYSMVLYLSLAYSLVCTLLAPLLISLLYGEAYSAAAGMLRLLVWYTAFSYLGGAQGIWMLAEGKQRYLMLTGALGAGGNILLNALLIPRLGGQGAALASLVTQVFANIVLCFLIPALRGNGRLLLRALDPRAIPGMLRVLGRRLRKKEE